MEILDEVRGIKDEVETMSRKKEKVADLLGEEMEEQSGLRLDGERRLYKRNLKNGETKHSVERYS